MMLYILLTAKCITSKTQHTLIVTFTHILLQLNIQNRTYSILVNLMAMCDQYHLYEAITSLLYNHNRPCVGL